MEDVAEAELPQSSPRPPAADRRSQRGVGGRIWSTMGLVGHLFSRGNKNDFEKRLQHLSKEEVALHSRLKRRTQYWRKLARAIIVYSVLGEALALAFAILSTRSSELPWQIRALRVLPVFALPALVTLLYSTCASYNRMRERKDHERLDRLKAERQEKINELKEKTNYYITQQLIQQYDPDPAAKAAAASILASKLGAESGLKLALAAGLTNKEELIGQNKSPDTGSDRTAPGSPRQDRETVESMGLRNRRSRQRRKSVGQAPSYGMQRMDGLQLQERGGPGAPEVWDDQGMEVGPPPRGKASDGGWVSRLAAMLVGEDPTQCYALICPKCHSHNGLARKEDFQYITYYCPHCQNLNGSSHASEDGIALKDEPNKELPKPANFKASATREASLNHRPENSAASSLGLTDHSTSAASRNVEVSSAGQALIAQLVASELDQAVDQDKTTGVEDS